MDPLIYSRLENWYCDSVVCQHSRTVRRAKCWKNYSFSFTKHNFGYFRLLWESCAVSKTGKPHLKCEDVCDLNRCSLNSGWFILPSDLMKLVFLEAQVALWPLNSGSTSAVHLLIFKYAGERWWSKREIRFPPTTTTDCKKNVNDITLFKKT